MFKKSSNIFAFVLLSLTFLTPGISLAKAFQLHLVHTNDLHAHLIPWTTENDDCNKANSRCLGGFARIQTFLDQERNRFPDLVLLDAGDRFSGTVFYTLRKSQDLIPLIDGMGYDAMVLGNHEFDDGLPELTHFVESIQTPVITANIQFPKDHPLSQMIKPTRIIERDGRKIGIIGALTTETKTASNKSQDVDILPEEPIIRAEIQKLKAQGINIIIVLSHLGIDADKALAKACPEIDIIVGGHTHVLLSNDPQNRSAFDRYPVVVKQPKGASGAKGDSSPSATQSLIVTSGLGGQYVGVMDVTFDEQGRITAYKGDTHPITQSILENESVKAYIRLAQESMAETLKKPLFISSEAISNTPDTKYCSESCHIGEVLSDAYLRSDSESDIAFLNGGGIRSSLPKGKITFEHLAQSFPFDSVSTRVSLTGAEIESYLRHGLSAYQKDDRTNEFLHTAGLSYDFDPDTRLPHNIRTETGPLQRGETYHVLMPSFLANGGDGYPVQSDRMIIADSVRDAIIAGFMKAHPGKFQNRIRKKPAVDSMP